MIKCPRCGLINPDDSMVCDCGLQMGSSQPASAPPRRETTKRRWRWLAFGVGHFLVSLYLFKGASSGSENPLFMMLLGLGASVVSGGLYLLLFSLASLVFWFPLFEAYLTFPGASWRSGLSYVVMALNSAFCAWAVDAIVKRRRKRPSGAAA